jgi:hypothetical protein
MSQIFGETRQIAFVTRDFDQTIEFFLKTGIGPWYVAKNRTMPNVDYRGDIVDIEISVGLANSGSLQYEVIEPTSDVPSIYRDFLDKYPGQLMVQHVASWPVDFHRTDARIRAAGYEAVMSANLPSGHFAYYEHPDHPEFVFETAEFNAGRRFVWGNVAIGAQHWDGTDPIRPWPKTP